jgi:hypothetical protein
MFVIDDTKKTTTEICDPKVPKVECEAASLIEESKSVEEGEQTLDENLRKILREPTEKKQIKKVRQRCSMN